MADKKITQKELYERIKAHMSTDNEVVDFCDKKIAQLNSKTSKADEKKSAEQNEIMESIKYVLSVKGGLSCTEIMKEVNATDGTDYSLNKISSMLRKLGSEGTNEVVKVMDKKVARFSLA